MLTINRDRTEEKRNRAYESRVGERSNYDSYRTLDEEYQNTIRENQNRCEDELWDRLNYSAPERTTEEDYDFSTRDYSLNDYEYREDYCRSSSFDREQETKRLPYYDTEATTSNMAMKKYPIAKNKKKNNVVGKIILAAYVAIVALVATLVIVDSTIKTTVASGEIPTQDKAEVDYIQVQDTKVSGNWFDRFCDSLSKLVGD